MENLNDYVYFVFVNNTNPHWGTTGYDDKEGKPQHIFKGRTHHKTGAPEPHRYKFDRAHRTIRVHKKDKCHIHPKNTVVTFLRNHPECEGSINGDFVEDAEGRRIQQGVAFKEINEGRDAEVAVAAKANKIKAGNKALELEGDELEAMAILCGALNKSESLQKHRVLEYADANPDLFMEMYNAPDRVARAVLRKAVDASIIQKRGTLYTWDGVHLGGAEDDAVGTLMKDGDMLSAIEQAIKKVGK